MTALRAADHCHGTLQVLLQLDFSDLGELVEIDPAHIRSSSNPGANLWTVRSQLCVLMKVGKRLPIWTLPHRAPGHRE